MREILNFNVFSTLTMSMTVFLLFTAEMEFGKNCRGEQAVAKKLLILIMTIGLLASSVLADENESKVEEIKASVIIPLKVEGLKWKAKYYQEKTITMQLRAMIGVWNQVEFQEAQRILRETDQTIKHLLLAK